MAIDPICGMTVDERTAISAERDGQKYYFCCESCRRKFLAGGQAVESQESRVKSQNLVNLTLGPVSTLNSQHSDRNTLYTCPMHPEIEQDHPGTCPKCGMALEPKTITSEPEDDSELRDMTRRFWVAVAL